jgi:uncharacterized OsmC-like protein/alpha/beta superfamily hydrolase
MDVRTERVEFTGAQGDILAARLDRPGTRPRAFAVFAHCFTCSKDVRAATRIARSLAEHGIATLRFDFTGLGHSEGEFANTTFSSNVGDLVAAADYLRANHGPPRLLVGHSLGGAAVLAAAAEVPDAAAVATIGAPSDPAHVTGLFDGALEAIGARGEAEVRIAGRGFRIRRAFLDDIAEQRLTAGLGELRKALMIFHGPFDQTVGIDNAARLFEAARHPKSFVSLDRADHMLSDPADAAYVGTVLAAWAERYIEAPARPALGDTGAGTVVVAETGESRFAQAIAAGGHRLRADEPLARGGGDSGPDPYELLLAALGACTNMTLRLYAERKGLALARASIRLRHEKIHAEDCAECETREGKVDRIERRITLEGDLDAGARDALLRIANRCPVHRTLRGEVVIDTALEPGGAT